MVNAQFSKFVASLETREGCPITPGAAFTKQFYLVPLASSNKDRRGIALDGRLKVIRDPPPGDRFYQYPSAVFRTTT